MTADAPFTPDGVDGALLDAAELERFCSFLYRQTGMAYGESKRYFIERRLADRMARTRAPTFSIYFAMLRVNPAEIEALINSFTVNETYFYREEHQLSCLARSILPEVVSRYAPGDLVRLWSVPCSTGEEPYSLALWLLENWSLVDAYHIEIVGSDIDSRAIDAAKAGFFGERSTARLPAGVVRAYFEAATGDTRRIISDIRESVTFTSANLIDSPSMAAQGRFDIVFCRNVLIYFDEASRLTAADNIWNALHPGGFVCLGHTESMARISDRFAVRRFPEAIVYQRPLQS